MIEDPDLYLKMRQIDLYQNEVPVAAADDNSTTITTTTIHGLPDEILGICHSYLGVGHFGFIAPVCKKFKAVYLANTVSVNNKFTNGESITSSISCVQQYLEAAGTDTKQLSFVWYNAARYGRLKLMAWAHQQGYSRVWKEKYRSRETLRLRTIGVSSCEKAAEYGRIDALKWLQQNGCEWDNATCSGAARGLAGMLGWTVAMPFDVPKTNVQSRWDTKVVGSYFPEFARIVRERGVAGLYHGLGPTLVRAFPANAALFLGVEMGKKFFDDMLWRKH